MDKWTERLLGPLLRSPNGQGRRPEVSSEYESNVPGVYIIGDLAGAPVVKLAMEQGYHVAEQVASRLDGQRASGDEYDVIVAGAGAAGLNAALQLKEHGLKVLVLEKNKMANTIEDFPEGKWVYAEPDSKPPLGKLWLDGARKEDLIERWREIVEESGLEVRTEEGLESLEPRAGGGFNVVTTRDTYRARRIILATGQRGNPRRLGVPGEEQERVYHRLYSPRQYNGEKVLVVGGGNSAVEAAITLAEQNDVTLSYRGEEFSRLFKDNQRELQKAIDQEKLEVVLNSNVKRFEDSTYELEIASNGSVSTQTRDFDHAFVLIGAEVPEKFLRSLGIRMENDWTGNLWYSALLTVLTFCGLWLYGGKTGVAALEGLTIPGLLLAAVSFGALIFTGIRGSRFSWLGVSFVICYTIYGAKLGNNQEFWPYKGWGYQALSFLGRPWSFWYTVLYTVLMTYFGFQAIRRWGLDRKDKFQIWRYVSLLGFQWIFFFIIPEFLFQWAVKYQWVGEQLANDPSFTNQAWRSYGLVYAWPLFFYTFFGSPHQIWIVWGVILTFVLIPILVLFHGKRYCSWICGCGGLAETLGDRWRHLAPKGKASIRWEVMNLIVLIAAVGVTGMMLLKDTVALFRGTGPASLNVYRLVADVWLVGILPVTLYPFMGGKVWCRYWCPLAKLMGIWSTWFTNAKWSRFAIHSNDKCIACGECTRNCQVGIDVMSYALKQDVLSNANSSCIGCGICVTVCPMDVLSFEPEQSSKTHQLVQIKTTKEAA